MVKNPPALQETWVRSLGWKDPPEKGKVSDSLQPHRRQPTGLLRPWDSPGKNTGVGATRVSWSPLSGLKGVQPPLLFAERTRDCSPGHTGREGPHLVCVLVTQSCLTLCNPIYCSLPGSTVHRIFQARILGWVAPPGPVLGSPRGCQAAGGPPHRLKGTSFSSLHQKTSLRLLWSPGSLITTCPSPPRT